ncbi:Alg9-like mannosyltransferase [Neohortaea acidophila]|uniref:Mannosyltransferase n=1 Tax=Neohortaea acidophila TaxID=245834 RepID=A0A6A6PWW7_9PEZI|nr:Alg9-like mannosyltransferase [Neohortaea acidophila]KAF2484668.1 Alg9-like mannosyltransferase [Neohortaea acidophila]
MWRRIYLLLVAVRLYFALQPSYIHPDEHFQGPEIISGEVFGWPTYQTWEFSSDHPTRSLFPLWLAYGFPLTILKWIWEGLGHGDVPPLVAFYTLRTLMFVLNFVLEDWALHELLPVLRERRLAIILVASSYVTWTFQTHTFSNSIETLLVLWSLVLVRRIREHEDRNMFDCCIGLAFLGVLGVFNRITFPAFLVIPALQLVPHLLVRPLRLPVLALSAFFFLAIAMTMDTEYFHDIRPRVRDLYNNAVFTPWNSLTYNLDNTNLAEHGLHPFWQHFLANLPQLIGPAFPLLIFSSRKDALFWSGIIGITVLSCFRHQEPRFLLPAIPLLLSSIKLPRHFPRLWLGTWIAFNVLAGTLFGVYHQGGVVPSQLWLSEQSNISHVLWWKTYSPPRWLLNGQNEHVLTTDLMGMPGESMVESLLTTLSGCKAKNRLQSTTLLVAPSSAIFLDSLTGATAQHPKLQLQELWMHRQHIGLDDLDFGDDGIWPTLQRVIGRRGLVVYRVDRKC